MEYVLNRKNYEEQIGNTLPIPSLLLKRSYIQDCYNEEEKLDKEEDYNNVGRGRGSGRRTSYSGIRQMVGNKAARKSAPMKEIKVLYSDNFNFCPSTARRPRACWDGRSRSPPRKPRA